jgi:hypothetical protein
MHVSSCFVLDNAGDVRSRSLTCSAARCYFVAMCTTSGQQLDFEDHLPNADRGCGRADEREHGGQHPRSSSIGSTDSYYPSGPLLH